MAIDGDESLGCMEYVRRGLFLAGSMYASLLLLLVLPPCDTPELPGHPPVAHDEDPAPELCDDGCAHKCASWLLLLLEAFDPPPLVPLPVPPLDDEEEQALPTAAVVDEEEGDFRLRSYGD